MRNLILTLAALLIFPALVTGGEKKEDYLKQMMIPRARELLLRIGQTNDLPSTTNQVQSYKVDFYDDGWLGNMQLTNGWVIRFFTDKRETNDSASHLPGKMEEAYLKEKMIPLAQKFLQQIGQTNSLPMGTNQVKNYKLSYFDDRPGCTADMRLTNGYAFGYYTETNKSEINSFRRGIKTYYGFADGSKAKIEAVKALNLQNKLNLDKALVLAKKYFKFIGHKEDNFHAPEIIQCYWSGGEDNRGGKLPYFEITWYRKDVTAKELEDNDSSAKLKTVIIEVSGIDSSLISYSKGLLPIGGDF